MAKTHTIDFGPVPTKVAVSKRKYAYVLVIIRYTEGLTTRLEKDSVDTMKAFIYPFIQGAAYR
jgi:hypothetical protein